MTFVLGLGLSSALAQEGELPPVSYPPLPQSGANAQAFVPTGWKIEAEIRGDLDQDRTDDLTLVLRQADPANVVKPYEGSESTLDSNPRMLAVALAEKAGGYRLALANHALIPRLDNPSQDDPLSESGGVFVDHGTLVVKLYLFMSAGGWDTGNTAFRFRLEDGEFRLIGYDNFNVNRGSGVMETTSINLLTGKVVISTGTISDDDEKTTIKKLKKNPRVSIADLGAWGEGFEPRY